MAERVYSERITVILRKPDEPEPDNNALWVDEDGAPLWSDEDGAPLWEE